MAYNASTGTQPSYLKAVGSLNTRVAWFPGGTTTCTYPTSPFTASVLPALSSFTMEARFATSQQSGSRIAWGSATVAQLGFDSATGYAKATVQCTSSVVTLIGTSTVIDGTFHAVALEVIGGATSTFNLYVDGVKQATATGVYAPSGTAGAISVAGLFQGYVEELRLSSVARYGGSNYTPATTIFSNNTANTICLHHLSSNSNDYTGNADLPVMGTISIGTSGGTDTITYPAATAGTNSITGYQLWYANSSGAETMLSSNTGAGSGTFTHATAASGANNFYYVVAVDSASNLSNPSNEVQSGFSSQSKNFILTNSGTTFLTSKTGFGQKINSATGSAYVTASTTIGPATDTWLPAGQAFTVELLVDTLGTTATQFIRGAGFSMGMNASGFPIATVGIVNTGTSSVTITSSTATINDGNQHAMALVCVPGAGPASLSTFSLYVDGVLAGSATAIRVPSSATQFICGFQWVGSVDELAISTIAQYSSGYTPAAAPFSQSRTGQIFLAHFDGTYTDSNGLLTLPSAPSASFSSTGGTDTISYTASTAGSNPIAGYALYVGTSSGGESATPYATNTGSGAGSFTHPAGAISAPYYYYVKAYDNASTPNYSNPSNEVYNLNSGQFIYANNSNIIFSPYNWNPNSSGSGATATANVVSNQVTSYTITNPGSNYATAPLVTITGGGGTGATATAVLGGGQVLYYNIKTGGTGYSSSFSVNITGGGGTGATATATAVGGVVTSITITAPGSGYTSIPTIDFSPGGGTGATGALGIGNFVVASLAVQSAGSGYTSTPTVTITANNSALTNNSGAYMRFNFTGTRVTLTFDTRFNVYIYPQLIVRIDGMAWQQYILQSSLNITPTPLANQMHCVEILMQAMPQNEDRWAQPVSQVNFTGMYIDSSATMMTSQKRKYNILIYGDSITEGYNTLNNLVTPYAITLPTDITLAWSYNTAMLMDAEFGIMGYIGSGITVQAYAGETPNLQGTYNYYNAGRARNFTYPAVPDMVIYLEGQNDGSASVSASAAQAGITAVINGILAATPTTKQVVMKPWLTNTGNNTVWTGLLAAVAAINNPLVTSFDTTGLFNASTDSLDGVHPIASAAIARLAPPAAAHMISLLSTTTTTGGGATVYIS